MKKPLPVKIVEAIGWVYVVLAVLSLLPMSKVMRLESSLYISSLPIAMLIGMVVALRRGRRTLFLLGNTVVMLLILLGLAGYTAWTFRGRCCAAQKDAPAPQAAAAQVDVTQK